MMIFLTLVVEKEQIRLMEWHNDPMVIICGFRPGHLNQTTGLLANMAAGVLYA